MTNPHLIIQRPRRLRRSATIRSLVAETHLKPTDFVWPLFVHDRPQGREPIRSMPGVERLSFNDCLHSIEHALTLGIRAFALFPAIDPTLKSDDGREAWNPAGLVPRIIQHIKKEFPEACLFSDVALDPYTTHGHDGLVKDGRILNDETLVALGRQALAQAEAGVDFVAPSDMMDGRVGFLRHALDENQFTDVGILAYTAKYASAFYGPFRDALSSTPQFGDKKTYQMNPANSEEALREASLDCAEGADILLVKPALSYLDIIYRIRQQTHLPIAAYNVSGEYSMIKLAAQQGLLDERRVVEEVLLSIKRAGADLIFSYHALEVAQWLKHSERA